MLVMSMPRITCWKGTSPSCVGGYEAVVLDSGPLLALNALSAGQVMIIVAPVGNAGSYLNASATQSTQFIIWIIVGMANLVDPSSAVPWISATQSRTRW
jgi:hypothetical protein